LHLPECDILVIDAMEDFIRDTALFSRDWMIMERQHPANSSFIRVRHEAGKISIRKFSAERFDYDRRRGLPSQATPVFSFEAKKTAYYWQTAGAEKMEWSIIGAVLKPTGPKTVEKEAVAMYNKLLTGNSGRDVQKLENGYTYEQFLPWLNELEPFLGSNYWLIGMRIIEGQRLFRPLGVISKIVLKDNGS
jgi:hypothetical protein